MSDYRNGTKPFLIHRFPLATIGVLPSNRSAYIDDFSDGDLSNGDKFGKVLLDAIANAPSGLDWSNLDAIMVVMAETDSSQFHRGQGTGDCNLPQGPGGSTKHMGCAIFSENPSVRVRIDTVASETVLGNQDGVDEQENIDYFQAVQPSSPGAANYTDIIKLHNDDALNPKFFQLSYTSNLPPGWTLDINGGNLGVQMSPNEIRDIPITITPGGGPDPAPGTTYAVEVLAQFQRDMVNTTDPTLPAVQKKHFEFKPLGGVRVEAKVMLPTKITCEAQRRMSVTGGPQVVVKGILIGLDKYDSKNPPRVMIEGVQNAQPTYLTNSLRVLSVDKKGQFIGVLGSDQFTPTGVICLFGGTDTLASSGAGPVPIADAPPPTTGSTTPGGGGGLIVPGKFSIHFPAGAFSSPLNLTYTPIFSPTHALPNGDAWLDFFTLDATANNQPVTQFDKPYTMVISYSGDLLRQLGVVETNLNVVFWDGNAWKPMLPCAGCGIDLNNHHITVMANHFTEFALIGTGDRRDVYLPIALR